MEQEKETTAVLEAEATEDKAKEAPASEVGAEKAEETTEKAEATATVQPEAEDDADKVRRHPMYLSAQRTISKQSNELKAREEQLNTISKVSEKIDRLEMLVTAIVDDQIDRLKAEGSIPTEEEQTKTNRLLAVKKSLQEEGKKVKEQQADVSPARVACDAEIKALLSQSGLTPSDQRLALARAKWTGGDFYGALEEVQRVTTSNLTAQQKTTPAKAGSMKADTSAPTGAVGRTWSAVQDAYIKGDISVEEYAKQMELHQQGKI